MVRTGEGHGMPTELHPGRHPGAARTWELELDAELPPFAASVTPERARALADLMAAIRGLDVLAVRPHCEGRFVLASLAIEAPSLADAVERAIASLRRSAVLAGIGPLILVGARHACPQGG